MKVASPTEDSAPSSVGEKPVEVSDKSPEKKKKVSRASGSENCSEVHQKQASGKHFCVLLKIFQKKKKDKDKAKDKRSETGDGKTAEKVGLQFVGNQKFASIELYVHEHIPLLGTLHCTAYEPRGLCPEFYFVVFSETVVLKGLFCEDVLRSHDLMLSRVYHSLLFKESIEQTSEAEKKSKDADEPQQPGGTKVRDLLSLSLSFLRRKHTVSLSLSLFGISILVTGGFIVTACFFENNGLGN